MQLAARLLVAVIAVMAGKGLRSQEPTSPVPEHIAFRVDEHRLVATTLLREHAGQIRDTSTSQPVARYGYGHFAVPHSWRERPFVEPPLGRWMVHVAPGVAIEATAEEVVGGYAQCQEAIGVLLRADPRHSRLLADSPGRYFVASPAAAGSFPVNQPSSIGIRPVPSSPAWRALVENVLDELLARELPSVVMAAAPNLSRMEKSSVGYHRSWARERLRIDAAMLRNESKREYDVQAFQLGPGAPVYFIRAQWLVAGRPGFAASLWLRTEPRIEIIETDLRPASWLRMFEFQGHIVRDHMGLILGVIDRNRDGLGEILFLQSGYEGFSLSVRSYSPAGFVTAGPVYASGC
jgi:hypothetical protein